jgi:uncharacterized membrane protein
LSTPDAAENPRREGLDTLVGLFASIAIFIGLLGITNFDMSIDGNHLQMRPVRVEVAAVTLALIAAGIGGRHRRLAAAAVAITAVCWLLAMTIAVLTQRPLF